MNNPKIKLIYTARKLDVLRIAAEKTMLDLEIPVEDPELQKAVFQYCALMHGAVIMLEEAVRDLTAVEDVM